MFTLLYFVILIFCIVIHEVSHGLAAKAQGDDTAEYAGRLTLNPVRHIDPIGTVLLPLFLVLTRSPIVFGWALPVPFNPLNLRNQRWGPAFVAIAGPFSNLTLAALFSVLIRFASPLGLESAVPFFAVIAYLNIVLALFNLVPIPPLDGSKILLAVAGNRMSWETIALFERYGIMLIILFLFFAFPLIQPLFPKTFLLFAGPDGLAGLETFLSLLKGLPR